MPETCDYLMPFRREQVEAEVDVPKGFLVSSFYIFSFLGLGDLSVYLLLATWLFAFSSIMRFPYEKMILSHGKVTLPLCLKRQSSFRPLTARLHGRALRHSEPLCPPCLAPLTQNTDFESCFEVCEKVCQ